MRSCRYFLLAGVLLALLALPSCGCGKREHAPARAPGVSVREDGRQGSLPGPAELAERAYASLEKGVYFEGNAEVVGKGKCRVKGWAWKDGENAFYSRTESWDDSHRFVVWYRSVAGGPAVLVLQDALTGETRKTELPGQDLRPAIYVYGAPAIPPNWGWYKEAGVERVGGVPCVVLDRQHGTELRVWVRPADGLPLRAAGQYVKGSRAVFEATRIEVREAPPGTFDLPG
ncbi:hypothetical protein Adeg_0732 [Ammonifex degensii KC4]|uniref:Uncharacterized protein n=1 Tax=Ammonifex degensii (strain DSM 10501 / KC4) TaxID=429009 RepID=C9RCA1_AMMDK|nr:hypothetical protein Adeg_0732 [Ammonifex degensii KC4]